MNNASFPIKFRSNCWSESAILWEVGRKKKKS